MFALKQSSSSTAIMTQMDSVKIIFLVFMVIAYLETPAASYTGEEDLTGELARREDEVNWAGYGDERLSTVVIGGKLLCHDHKLHTKAVPVSGASVAVFCGTNGWRKKSWAKGGTDSYGQFLIDLPSDLHVIPNLEKVNCSLSGWRSGHTELQTSVGFCSY